MALLIAAEHLKYTVC